MEAVRIELRAYTASFRVPGMMGYQITAPIPPPATIYGLIAAAVGREVTPEESWIAYRFEYDPPIQQDLEKIISFEEGGPKWNDKLNAVKSAPIIRQFLFNPRLVLYLSPGEVAVAFLRPRYPLVLGRSQDVAYVSHYQATVIEPIKDPVIAGVLVPFPAQGIQSQVLSFPTYFDMATRGALRVRPFHIVDWARGRQVMRNSGETSFYQEAGSKDGLAVPMFDKQVLTL